MLYSFFFFSQGGLITSKHSDQLLIALEPEAASLHCRKLPGSTFVGCSQPEGNKPTFEPGTKYLVVDAGGKFRRSKIVNFTFEDEKQTNVTQKTITLFLIYIHTKKKKKNQTHTYMP